MQRHIRKKWIDNCLKKPNDKYGIAGAEIIPEWVNTLRELRNVCAHMGRLYSHNMTYSPNLKNLQESGSFNFDEDIDFEKFKHTLLAGLIIIREFYVRMDRIRISEWNEFIEKLCKKMKELDISSESLGQPDFDCSTLLIF